MKYTNLSRELLDAIGGNKNISHITYCATRLRITYKQKDLIDEDALNSLPDSKGVIFSQGQAQIIIGVDVLDAYNEFMRVSGWNKDGDHTVEQDVYEGPKNASYYLNKFGNFVAPIFMPIIPALIAGGLILAVKNLLVNYLGFAADSGTALVMMAIFNAAFFFLPIYVGYTLAQQLKMQPIMGAFLGALMVSSEISGVSGLDFLGISIPTAEYGGSVFPIVLGVFFMYFVDKGVRKIVPEALKFVMTPLLTMTIVVPVTLIALGPIGTLLSSTIATFVLWLTNTLGFIAIPILAVLYPYFVMFGIDKALTPVGIDLVSTVGYDSVIFIMGFISNIAIGATALAVASTIKDKAERGAVGSFGLTGLLGITEPAFYGSLIAQPQTLLGTAIGAASAGVVAGLLELRVFIHGGGVGLTSFVYFIDNDGGLTHLWYAILVAAIAIVVSFIATRIILSRISKSEALTDMDTLIEQ